MRRYALVLIAVFFALPALLLSAAPLTAQQNTPLYTPTIASPNSTLTGTTGPSGSVNVDFQETQDRREHRTIVADAAGRFILKAPANALGIDFSVSGSTQHTVVSKNPSLIVGGLSAERGAVSGSLAIVAGQTAYDINQPLKLQVRNFDPLRGKLLIGGDLVTPLAASDRSVIGNLSASLPLGRRSIGILTNGRTVAIQADIVRTSLSVNGPSDYRIPRTVSLSIFGLFGDRASVRFDVTGGAKLGNGQDTQTVPVSPAGTATTTVEADKPGAVKLDWSLKVDLGYHIGNYNYETPRPAVAPSPTPLIPCRITLTDGWFSAAQGPYQDDPVFTQKPKQLIRNNENPITYYGELNMVKDRPSALMGVNAYVKDGQLVKVNSRDNIVMRGESNCSEYGPVKIRFTLYEGHSPRVIYTSDTAGYVFYKGGARPKYEPWQANVSTISGVPETPFYFTRPADHYEIMAALVDEKNNDLGLHMWLDGYTQQSTGPLIRLLPVVLSISKSPSSLQNRSEGLLKESQRLQNEMYQHVPDVYPLKPHGLPMPLLGEPVDLTGKVFDTKWDDAISFDTTIQDRYKQNLQAAIDDRISTTTSLQGASRTVVVLNDGDYDTMRGTDSNGFSMSTKTVVTRWGRPWTTPAHEVAHTLPQFLWSSDQMLAQCGLDYHNKDEDVAFGLQTMELSRPITGRQHVTYPPDIMQGSGNVGWISQCTYANLLDALRYEIDPQILVLRFYLARPVHGGVIAHMRPAYVTQGMPTQPGGGRFAVIAYDRAGAMLQQEKFEPQWMDDDNFVRNIISVQMRFKWDPRIARVEVRGPNAVLGTVTMSARAPVVAIDSARRSGRSVRVAWHGSGDRGRELLYSVFLSQDGKTYDDTRAFEQTAASAALYLPTKFYHPRFVKVVVTDGSRSSQAVRRF